MLSTTGSIVNTQCTSLLVFDYPANFKLSEEDNVKVYYVTALGVETLLVDGPDYAITLISETGFNVELVTSFDTGSISIRRETPQVQETEFKPGGDFPASAFEDTLDRLVMMQQEMQDILDRAIVISKSDDAVNLELPIASVRANRYQFFDADGNITTKVGTIPASEEISAADIPIVDVDDNYTAEEVEAALKEIAEKTHADLDDMPSSTNPDHDDRYLNLNGANGEQNFIDFDLANGVSAAEGRLVWNDDEGTLNLGLKGGTVNLQIGQEMVVRAKNTSGSTIANGTPVRISGASGSNPEIGLSDADNPAAAGSFGLTTEEILNNQFGYVTTFGLVRDIDTSGTPVSETWSNADRIFVSDTAGELTNVYPTGDSRIILVGIVLRAHVTEGIILVYPINVSFVEELSGNDDGSGNPILSIDGANKKVDIDGSIETNKGITVPVMHVQDQKTAGTDGGTFTADVWRTRDLTIALTNTINGASLVVAPTSQITLPVGTYKIDGFAPAFLVRQNMVKLRNISDSSDILLGTSEYMNSSIITGRSFIRGIFTLAEETVLEIQHICDLTHAGNGFGIEVHNHVAGGVGHETYTDVFIEKIG